MLRYFSEFSKNDCFQVDLCKVNSLLKPCNEYLATLPDWCILSRDIENQRFFSKQKIKKIKIMKSVRGINKITKLWKIYSMFNVVFWNKKEINMKSFYICLQCS